MVARFIADYFLLWLSDYVSALTIAGSVQMLGNPTEKMMRTVRKPVRRAPLLNLSRQTSRTWTKLKINFNQQTSSALTT